MPTFIVRFLFGIMGRSVHRELFYTVERSEKALAEAMATIRSRWGLHSLLSLETYRRPSRPATSPPNTPPPWWPAAIPTANLLELRGGTTAPPLTLTLLWLAALPSDGPIAIIDLDRCMQPSAAVVCGIDLRRLVIIRPPHRHHFFPVAIELTRCDGFDAVLGLLNSTIHASFTEASQLRSAATEAQTTVLFTHKNNAQRPSIPLADTRLHVSRQAWLWEDGELAGQHLHVDTERSRLGLVGTQYELRLRLYRQGTHGTQPDHLYLDSTLCTRGQRSLAAAGN